jgi:hypothetical protein
LKAKGGQGMYRKLGELEYIEDIGRKAIRKDNEKDQ